MKSLIAYFIVTVSLIVFSFTYYPKYEKSGGEATISWDVSGYYWYLPALFIYKDIKELRFTDSLRSAYECSPDNQQIFFLPDGSKVMKYSSGMAIQYSPFFLIAHVLAKPFGFARDGLSLPYQLAIHFGALCMMLMGLWFLRKVLLDFFKDSTVAILLVLLAFGTNYTDYATIDLGMSHAWLFAWYCVLMYASNRFYKRPNFKLAALIGLVTGVLILSRPTEMIAVILPLLWGISSLNVIILKERMQFIRQHFSKYVLAIFCTVLIGSIQLIYWKHVSGHWLVYSYGDEKFSWFKPHIMDYVFSFRCGWLLYCPMMILPFLGFFMLGYKKMNFIPILVFSIFYFWIVTAWDVWDYGGRAMLQGSSVLMFPLCALIETVNSKRVFQFLFYPIALFFLYVNIWWLHGVHRGMYVSTSEMTKAYYYKTFGRLVPDPANRKFLFLSEEYTGDNQNGEVIYQCDFEKDTSNTIFDEGHRKLFMEQFSTTAKVYPVSDKAIHKSWLRFFAHVKCLKNNWDSHHMTSMGIRLWDHDTIVKQNALQLDQLFYNDQDQEIFIDMKVPEKAYNKVEIFVINDKDAKGEFLIDDIKVTAFE